MAINGVMLSVEADSPVIARARASISWLEWGIAATDAHARAPLNLAVLADLRETGTWSLEALRKVLAIMPAALTPRDCLAVLACKAGEAVLLPSAPLDRMQRLALRAIRRALALALPGDFAACWQAAGAQLHGRSDGTMVSRVLLLATGPVPCLHACARQAASWRQQGISASIFAIGTRCQLDDLEALAIQSGGRFYHCLDLRQCVDNVRRDIDEASTVVARNMILQLTAPPGYDLTLAQDLPQERPPGGLHVFLGDLAAGERRRIYTRACMTAQDAPLTALFTGVLQYTDLPGNAACAVTAAQTLYVTDEAPYAPGGVTARANDIQMARAAVLALARARQVDAREGAQVLRAQLTQRAAMLREESTQYYAQLAARIEGGMSLEEEQQAVVFAHGIVYARDSACDAMRPFPLNIPG